MSFQSDVEIWMQRCFGAEITADPVERNHRFIEEALELIQANGATASEAHYLVDYVFARPVGRRSQEVGGVMVTLAALCNTTGDNVDLCAGEELRRCWRKIDTIRAKQAAKPQFGPLP